MKSVVWFSILVAGCGGGSEEQEPAHDATDVEDPYAHGGGGEGAGEGESGTEATPPASTEGAQASVMVKAVMEGNEVAARIQILGEDGHVVSEGEAPLGAQITSGTYTFTAQISDESVLVDRPTVRNEGVEVAPGGPHAITISVPRASVRLKVVRNGRLVRGPEVSLMHAGSTDVVHRFHPGNDHISISPGRYEADIKIGTSVIHVQGITFMEGATQDIPIEVTQ